MVLLMAWITCVGFKAQTYNTRRSRDLSEGPGTWPLLGQFTLHAWLSPKHDPNRDRRLVHQLHMIVTIVCLHKDVLHEYRPNKS